MSFGLGWAHWKNGHGTSEGDSAEISPRSSSIHTTTGISAFQYIIGMAWSVLKATAFFFMLLFGLETVWFIFAGPRYIHDESNGRVLLAKSHVSKQTTSISFSLSHRVYISAETLLQIYQYCQARYLCTTMTFTSMTSDLSTLIGCMLGNMFSHVLSAFLCISGHKSRKSPRDAAANGQLERARRQRLAATFRAAGIFKQMRLMATDCQLIYYNQT